MHCKLVNGEGRKPRQDTGLRKCRWIKKGYLQEIETQRAFLKRETEQTKKIQFMLCAYHSFGQKAKNPETSMKFLAMCNFFSVIIFS